MSRLRRYPDPSERLRAVLALPAGESACRALLEAVGDLSLDVARTALRRLVPLAGPAEIAALRERMLTLDIGIVGDVARALRVLGDARATEKAVAGLEHASSFDRHKAAIGLRELCDPSARTALVRTLEDRESAVRRVALEALARLPADPETITACRGRLADSDTLVRAAAVSAIAALDSRASITLRPLLVDPHPTVRRAAAGAVDVLDDDEVHVLVGDPDVDVRVAVFEALNRHPRPQLLSILAAALGDPSWHVRRAAADAIGSSGRSDVAPALVRLLVDPHPTVRGRALLALKRLLGDDLDRALEQEVGSVRAPLRRAIVEILGARGRLDLLPRLADDADVDVRVALVHVLAHASSAEARAVLRHLAEDRDPAVRNAVATVVEGTSSDSST